MICSTQNNPSLPGLKESDMSNLDVAVSSFWQLARHWKQGDKAKLELSCVDGTLHMQLSAVLGHPDQPHFPHPPPPAHPPSPPPPVKKKSPSQLRRQVRRQREAEAKADEAVPNINIISEDNENHLFKDASTSKETEIVEEAVLGETAVKLAKNTAEESLPIFKCNQCNYQNKTEKGLVMHERKKHRISQVDGMDDFHEETSEVLDIVTLKLDELGGIVGPDLPPNTMPPSKVLHPKAGIGYKQQELSTSCGDTFVSYEFPDDPRGIHLYDVFEL